MRTYEEWLDFQKLDPASVSPEEEKAWRQLYEDGLKRQQRPGIAITSPAKTPDDRRYAIAFKDGAALWLCLWIRRSAKGDYYVLPPLGEPHDNPHASYHRDGQYHHKNHDYASGRRKRQPPNAGFRGTENVILTPVSAREVRATNSVCDPQGFSDMLEVPIGHIDPGSTNIGTSRIVIDLVEPGETPPPEPGCALIAEKRFTDHVPHILVTVWRKT